MQGSCQVEKLERKDRAPWIVSDASVKATQDRKQKIKRAKKARDLRRASEHAAKIVAVRGGNKL